MKKLFEQLTVTHIIVIIALIVVISYISLRKRKIKKEEKEHEEETKPFKYFSLKEIAKKHKLTPDMFTVAEFKNGKMIVNDKGKSIVKKLFDELNEKISEDSEIIGTLLMLKTKGDFAVIEWLYNDYIHKGKELLIPNLKHRMFKSNWIKAKSIIEKLPLRY